MRWETSCPSAHSKEVSGRQPVGEVALLVRGVFSPEDNTSRTRADDPIGLGRLAAGAEAMKAGQNVSLTRNATHMRITPIRLLRLCSLAVASAILSASCGKFVGVDDPVLSDATPQISTDLEGGDAASREPVAPPDSGPNAARPDADDETPVPSADASGASLPSDPPISARDASTPPRDASPVADARVPPAPDGSTRPAECTEASDIQAGYLQIANRDTPPCDSLCRGCCFPGGMLPICVRPR